MKILMPDLMKVEFNTRVLQEARSLKADGHEVAVVGFSNRDRTLRRVIQGIDCFSFFLSDKRKTRWDVLGRYLSAAQMLLGVNGIILAQKAKVYHAHNFHSLPAAVLSAWLHGGKVIYDSHESWTIHRHGGFHPEHLFALISESLFLRFVDGFVTVNEMVEDFYHRKYEIPDGLVLYNTHPLRPLVRQYKFHEELELAPGRPVVLFQGGFYDKLRGIEELIDAAPLIDESAVVVFLGFGPATTIENMRARIAGLGLQERVFIVPPQKPDEILDYTMSADVGMNLITRAGPAQDFQSPWKLFEYCMSGLAIVSTDLPFHRTVHERYDLGPLCPTNNDPGRLADLVNGLLRDEAAQKRHRLESRRAAEEEFCWEQQEKKLLAYYELVVGRR